MSVGWMEHSGKSHGRIRMEAVQNSQQEDWKEQLRCQWCHRGMFPKRPP